MSRSLEIFIVLMIAMGAVFATLKAPMTTKKTTHIQFPEKKTGKRYVPAAAKSPISFFAPKVDGRR